METALVSALISLLFLATTAAASGAASVVGPEQSGIPNWQLQRGNAGSGHAQFASNKDQLLEDLLNNGRSLHQWGFLSGGDGRSFIDRVLGREPSAPSASPPTQTQPSSPPPNPPQGPVQSQNNGGQAAQQQQQPQQQPSIPPLSNQNYFTLAPAQFNYAQVPTYGSLSQTYGSVSSSALASVAPPGECKSLGAVLSSIPEASQWLSLMRRAGLENILLNDRSAKTTLLIPINSAFNAAIDAQPLRPERSLQELINNAPDIVAPLVGYTVLRGLYPSAALNPGTWLPTSNTIDKVNPLQIQVTGQNQLQGIGNGATILQANIAACGPSVIHIIDQILLPFRFDQGPTDAITGTQVQGQSRPSYSAAGR